MTENQNPLVSILLPFKNTDKYLAECLQSILNQSYNNWELIAVDDHSTDTSRDIVAGFARRDTRIRVVTNSGNGIIEALRQALGTSSGVQVTRMDSDDRMTSGKLEMMSRSLLQFGEGHVAVGYVRYFSSEGISDGYARYEKWLNGLTASGSNFSEVYKECVIPSPCWMTSRKDLDRCGGFQPNRYPEDYDLTFRFYQNNLKCIPVKEVLHWWRDHKTRTSRTSHRYAVNYFLDIKLHYFLLLDHDKQRHLTLWGAGNKGKSIAKGLLQKGIDFHWLCDNPRKIGKNIYGKEMLHYEVLGNMDNPQSLITVANAGAQRRIRNFLRSVHHKPLQDYFFFC